MSPFSPPSQWHKVQLSFLRPSGCFLYPLTFRGQTDDFNLSHPPDVVSLVVTVLLPCATVDPQMDLWSREQRAKEHKCLFIGQVGQTTVVCY